MSRRAFAVAMVLACASADRAAAIDYPSATCTTTLQACINGASPGDTIAIVTNTPIVESPTITKSLVLTAGVGFSPVINGLVFFQNPGATAVSSTISAVTVNGTIAGLQISTGAFDLHIVANSVNLSSSFGIGIRIDSSAAASAEPVTFEVRDNIVTVAGSSPSDQCHGIMQGGLPAAGSGTTAIVGNHVTVTDCGQGSAIEVTPAPGDAVSADILRNVVVATNTDNGILARNFASSTTTLSARIVDNTVTGQTYQAGFGAALGALADGNQSIAVMIVNNTVAYNEIGLRLSARTDLGADITGIVANNIVAHHHGTFGTGLGVDSTLSASNEHNLVFDNDNDDFVPGAGTVTDDPLLVSTTDFHLQLGSPAVNAGNNLTVPVDITTDIEGNTRIQQSIVDIGAFESPFATPVVEIPASSTAGRLLLAGLLAAAGWIVTRRG